MKKIKILLVIRSLFVGGAERQWVSLAQGLAKNAESTEVELLLCTLYSGGELEKEIQGIPHICLHKKGKGDFLFLWRYRKVLKDFKPACIYAFMPDSNLFSLLASSFLKIPVVWGFRSSGIDVAKLSLPSKIYFYLQKLLSSKAAAIICNSSDAIRFYQECGYCMQKAKVIYNGIDTEKFAPIPCQLLRESLQIPEDSFVFGIAARMDKVKDYPLLARGAREILAKNPKVFFIAIGKINPSILEECQGILGELQKRFLFLGVKNNTQEFYSLFDCILSTSYTESFSNSIAEAMACECIPLVSDVGESRIIANFRQNYPFYFPKKDLESFLKGLDSILALPKDSLQHYKKQARIHITQNFSTQKMVQSTLEELKRCL